MKVKHNFKTKAWSVRWEDLELMSPSFHVHFPFNDVIDYRMLHKLILVNISCCTIIVQIKCGMFAFVATNCTPYRAMLFETRSLFIEPLLTFVWYQYQHQHFVIVSNIHYHIFNRGQNFACQLRLWLKFPQQHLFLRVHFFEKYISTAYL